MVSPLKPITESVVPFTFNSEDAADKSKKIDKLIRNFRENSIGKTHPSISGEVLIEILNILRTKIVDLHETRGDNFFKTYTGIVTKYLYILEICYRKDPKFKLEIATSVFQKHLEDLMNTKKENELTAKAVESKKKVISFDPNGDSNFAITPVGFAVQKNSPALLEALINVKADIDNGYNSAYPHSPLDYITYHETDRKLTVECIDILIKHKCDLNKISDRSRETYIYMVTPLSNLVWKTGSEQEIRTLVNAKADINGKAIREQREWSLINEAIVADENFSKIEVLIELGADPFEVDFDDLSKYDKGKVKNYLMKALAAKADQIRELLLVFKVHKDLSNIVIRYLGYDPKPS